MRFLHGFPQALELSVVEYVAGLCNHPVSQPAFRHRLPSGDEAPCSRVRPIPGGMRRLGEMSGSDVWVHHHRLLAKDAALARGRALLAGADALIITLDAQAEASRNNLEIVREVRARSGHDPMGVNPVPMVLQFTNGDTVSAQPVSLWLAALGLAGLPFVEAFAAEGTERALRVAGRLALRLSRALTLSEDAAPLSGPVGFCMPHRALRFDADNDVWPDRRTG